MTYLIHNSGLESKSLGLDIYIMMNGSASMKGIVGVSSGNDRILVECVKRWIESNPSVKVHMITTSDGKDKWLSYGLYNLNYIVSQHKHFYEFRGPISWHVANTILGSLKAITIPIKGKNIVIISSSEFLADSLPSFLLKSRCKKAKLIVGFYLFAPNPFKQNVYRGLMGKLKNLLWYTSQKPVYWIVKKYASMIFVTNDLDRAKFIRDGVAGHKVVTVGIGVDTELPKMVPEPKEKIYDAVFLGRFHPQKGVLELIDIWRKVVYHKKDAKLAIIGTGELEAEIKHRIENYGLTDNIFMLGFKDGIEKVKAFKYSKIMLEPSIYASGGMATYEAMSCGLPAICFDLPVWHSYFPKGIIRVKAFDHDAFAKSILNLLENKELYAKLSSESVELAESASWDKKAQQLLENISTLFIKDAD